MRLTRAGQYAWVATVALACVDRTVPVAVEPVEVPTGGACTSTPQCAEGNTCVQSVCRRELGQGCSDPGHCASGYCVDGVCCDSACAGDCVACGRGGVCAPVVDGTGCNDGDPCTRADACGGGACAGDAELTCLGSGLFADATAAAGVAGVANTDGDWGQGYGIAWGDYDGDGWIDLWVGIGGPPDDGGDPLYEGLLYRNLGDGSFARVEPAPRGHRAGAWADAEGDGDLDLFTSQSLYLATSDARLYLNEGAGTFVEAETDVGLGGAENLGTGVWLDANADGHIDLFFPNGNDATAIPPGPNQLRLNQGGAPPMFTTDADPGLQVGASNGETCTAADVDNDGDIDLWYNAEHEGRLYLNDGAGSFTEAAAAAGVALAVTNPPDQPYYAPVFGDYNNDGWLDLFLGHPDGTANRLYANLGGPGATFALQRGAAWLEEDLGHSRGAAWGDVDHDGDLDLVVANEQNDGTGPGLAPAANALYENRGVAGFVNIASLVGLTSGAPARSMSASLADYDNDGDLDLFFTAAASPATLWRNTLDDDKYLKVSAVGRGGAGSSSTDGIGARVELWNRDQSELLAMREVSGGEGYGSQSPRLVHFGLASAWGGGRGTYVVRVRFVSGEVRLATAVVPVEETLVQGSTTLHNTIEVLE